MTHDDIETHNGNDSDNSASDESFVEKQQQVADELFDVHQAIEDVDYNLLEEKDLAHLLEVKDVVEELTQKYRTGQHQGDHEGGTNGK